MLTTVSLFAIFAMSLDQPRCTRRACSSPFAARQLAARSRTCRSPHRLWKFSDGSEPTAASDDDEIITAHLSALLSQSRCKVFRIQADPRSTTISQLEKLQATDAVVVLGKFNDSDLNTIRSVVPHTIDARVRQPSTQPHLAATALRPDPRGTDQAEVDAIYTGVVPIVYKAQRALLNSLVESTLWSFLTITPIMMFVSRSFAAGAVAMLPNVLPVIVIFGGMGWLGIPIDIGSMMTASIALGVAVDDTIHFLARYREDLDHHGERREAIVATYQHCAIPTLQAAMISGLGLSVFAFSTFTPTQRFGWLMLTILLAGVVSELIMLPALLAGPLGRVFKPATAARSFTNGCYCVFDIMAPTACVTAGCSEAIVGDDVWRRAPLRLCVASRKRRSA